MSETSDANKVLTVAEAHEESGFSPATIKAALRSGNMRGRFVGGSKGWVTTRAALFEWVESGNATDTTGGDENNDEEA